MVDACACCCCCCCTEAVGGGAVALGGAKLVAWSRCGMLGVTASPRVMSLWGAVDCRSTWISQHSLSVSFPIGHHNEPLLPGC